MKNHVKKVKKAKFLSNPPQSLSSTEKDCGASSCQCVALYQSVSSTVAASRLALGSEVVSPE